MLVIAVFRPPVDLFSFSFPRQCLQCLLAVANGVLLFVFYMHRFISMFFSPISVFVCHPGASVSEVKQETAQWLSGRVGCLFPFFVHFAAVTAFLHAISVSASIHQRTWHWLVNRQPVEDGSRDLAFAQLSPIRKRRRRNHWTQVLIDDFGRGAAREHATLRRLSISGCIFISLSNAVGGFFFSFQKVVLVERPAARWRKARSSKVALARTSHLRCPHWKATNSASRRSKYQEQLLLDWSRTCESGVAIRIPVIAAWFGAA